MSYKPIISSEQTGFSQAGVLNTSGALSHDTAQVHGGRGQAFFVPHSYPPYAID